MISFMCAIKKIKQENKTPKLTDTENRLVVARDWGVGEMRERAQKNKNLTKQMSWGWNVQYGDQR